MSSNSVNSNGYMRENPAGRQGEVLKSKRYTCLKFFTSLIEATAPRTCKSLLDRINIEIKKIEKQKNLKNRIFGEGAILSHPGVIKKEHLLTSDVILAPAPKVVRKIQNELTEAHLSYSYVEMILQSLLLAESFAHYLFTHSEIYSENTPVQIRTYHDDGTFAADIIYNVRAVITEQGLNAFLLIPQNTPSGMTPEVKMIFVGTKDWAGFKRDLEAGAAGNRSFENHKDLLLTQLNKALDGLQNVKITITGHSLGGADAQRMVSEIVRLRRLGDDRYSQLRDVKISLRLETSAAPGLTPSQCQQFAEDLQDVTNRQKERFEFRGIGSIYHLDVIPTCGHQHILANPIVLSSSAQVLLLHTKLNLFQHESELYCNERKVPSRKVQIFQTTKTSDGAESPREEETRQIIIGQLQRSFRIAIR